MFKQAIVFIGVLFLSGCAGKLEYDKAQQLGVDLQARQYNSVASRFMDRPTFVSIAPVVAQDDVLVVSMNPYGSAHRAATRVVFTRAGVEQYLEHIDTFHRWVVTATEAGDSLNRDIGRGPSLTGEAIRFSAYSGNVGQHYLVLTHCVLGMCDDEKTQYFDEQNVERLRVLIAGFGAGDIVAPDRPVYD